MYSNMDTNTDIQHEQYVESHALTFLLPGLLNFRQLVPGLGVVQRGEVVKQVGHEGQVELLHAAHNVGPGNEGSEMGMRV